MSAVRSKSSDDPISYDAAAVLATGGIHQVDLDDLEGPLSTAREESLSDLERWRADGAEQLIVASRRFLCVYLGGTQSRWGEAGHATHGRGGG